MKNKKRENLQAVSYFNSKKMEYEGVEFYPFSLGRHAFAEIRGIDIDDMDDIKHARDFLYILLCSEKKLMKYTIDDSDYQKEAATALLGFDDKKMMVIIQMAIAEFAAITASQVSSTGKEEDREPSLAL